MHFTKHAELRLLERSSLTYGDIENILIWGAYILLGSMRGRLYTLFYSPTDERCYIALLSTDERTVISVMPDNYHLHSSLQRVTDTLRERAKFRYFTIVASTYIQADDVDAVATLYVQRGYESESCQLGAVPIATALAKHNEIVATLAAVLDPIVQAVHDAQLNTPVMYTIVFRTTRGETIHKHTFRHNKKLRKQLKQAQ